MAWQNTVFTLDHELAKLHPFPLVEMSLKSDPVLNECPCILAETLILNYAAGCQILFHLS